MALLYWLKKGANPDHPDDEASVPVTRETPFPVTYVPDEDNDVSMPVTASIDQTRPGTSNRVVVGKVLTVYKATGTGAIALSSTMAKAFRLLAVTVHFSAAPTTSENLTIKINASDGAAYDTTLLSTNPSTGAVTDIVYIPDGDGLICESGDEIDIAFTNTDGRTYGARIVCEAV